MRRVLRRLDERAHRLGVNGPRGAGLLAIGLVCLFQGWRYTLNAPTDLPKSLKLITEVGLPIQLYGVLWAAAGVLAIWSAFRTKDLPGIFAVVSMHYLWASTYAIGVIFHHADELAACVVYLGTAVLCTCWARMINPPRSVDLNTIGGDRG